MHRRPREEMKSRRQQSRTKLLYFTSFSVFFFLVMFTNFYLKAEHAQVGAPLNNVSESSCRVVVPDAVVPNATVPDLDLVPFRLPDDGEEQEEAPAARGRRPPCDIFTPKDGGLMGNRVVWYMKSTLDFIDPLLELPSKLVSVEDDRTAPRRRRKYDDMYYFSYQRLGELKWPLSQWKDEVKVSIKFNPLSLKLLEANRKFLKKWMTLHPRVQVEVDKYVSGFKGKVLIGLQVRRTDKMDDEPCLVRSIVPGKRNEEIGPQWGEMGRGVSFCFTSYFTGREILDFLEKVTRHLNLDRKDVVYVVSTDDPRWCHQNIMPDAKGLKFDIRIAFDHYKEKVVNKREIESKHFDWGVLLQVDHFVYFQGTFATTAALLGRCQEVFLPRYLPGPEKLMSLESNELNYMGMVGNGSRYHFLEDLP